MRCATSTEGERKTAEAELTEILGGLETLCARVRSVCADLPTSPDERLMYLGEEEFDAPTLIRSTLECLLADRLEPAVGELRALVRNAP